MTKSNDYDIDINVLANNPKAIQELLNSLTSMHESLALAKSETTDIQERFKIAFDALDDGFLIFDKQDKLVLCNEAQLNSFGEAQKFIIPGVTFKEMMINIAKSGIIPGIKGKEEEFVDDLIEKRKNEAGHEKTFKLMIIGGYCNVTSTLNLVT